jgi:hypothetical protein
MVNRVKRGWANFFLMMECRPESGHCHSVCTLWADREICSLFQRVSHRLWEKKANEKAVVIKQRALQVYQLMDTVGRAEGVDNDSRFFCLHDSLIARRTNKLARVQTKNTCFLVSTFCWRKYKTQRIGISFFYYTAAEYTLSSGHISIIFQSRVALLSWACRIKFKQSRKFRIWKKFFSVPSMPVWCALCNYAPKVVELVFRCKQNMWTNQCTPDPRIRTSD